MGDTYFLYMWKKNMDQGGNLKKVCKRYLRAVDLLVSIIDWAGLSPNINDANLIDMIDHLLKKRNIVHQCDFTKDALVLYNRCNISYRKIKKNWEEGTPLNYEDVFNMLVNLCWLLASVQYSEQEKKSHVMLLSNKEQICNSIRDYLDITYDAAIRINNEPVYIEDAISARNRDRTTGYYTFRHEESKEYYYSDYTKGELIQLKEKYERRHILYLTTYYELTITCGLANAIMRGY